MKNYSKITILTLLALIWVVTTSFKSNKESSLEKYLSKIEAQYESISIELGTAYWNYYSGESDYDLISPKDKYIELLGNAELNSTIEKWYKNRSEIEDTILKRRIEVWHSTLLSAKVEYDPNIMALRNELEKMLEVTDESSQSDPAEFDQKMIELIKLRNKKSQELGFDNYVHLSFENNGLGYQWFKDFIEELDKATFDSYKALVDEHKAQKKLESFDQRSAFQLFIMFYRNMDPPKPNNKDVESLISETLANIGIDYSTLSSKLVEKQLPPGVGGQGIMVNIPNDFRAVMALGVDFSTWMHEMGHGLHGLLNTIESPILKGYEWIPGNGMPTFSEGMAETMAWITRNPEWMKKYTSINEKKMIEKKETLKKYAPAFIRYHLFNFIQEWELYLNPDKSYDDIQLDLAKKYFLLETDQIRTQSMANIIYVAYPLYLQNYMMADMVAFQVHDNLKQKFGDDFVFNKEVGKYLQENYYMHGEYFTWQERLIRGTGKELDLDAYLKYYQIK